MVLDIQPGMCISFLYPSCNYGSVRRPKFERRRLRVIRVRHLGNEPLDPFTIATEPDRRRGECLVIGMDLDKGRERSFYVESMRDVEECDPIDIEPHEVVLLDKDDSSPELVHAAGSADEAIAWVREWLKEPMGFTVGIRRTA